MSHGFAETPPKPTHYFSGMFRVFVLLLSCFPPLGGLGGTVREWQRRLNLTDWTITVRVVNRNELDDGTQADIEANYRNKTALMRVMRAQDSDLSGPFARADQRLSVIHEMVHLHRFALHDPRWSDEAAIVQETTQMVHKYHCIRESLALEE